MIWIEISKKGFTIKNKKNSLFFIKNNLELEVCNTCIFFRSTIAYNIHKIKFDFHTLTQFKCKTVAFYMVFKNKCKINVYLLLYSFLFYQLYAYSIFLHTI